MDETIDVDLTEKFIEKVKDGTAIDMTWDDFFDEFGVDRGIRNDAIIAIIYRQAKERGAIDY